MSASARKLCLALAVLVPVGLAIGTSFPASSLAAAPSSLAGSPINHVVVFYMENHSFNELMGKLCLIEDNRCKANNKAKLSDGSRIKLAVQPDIVNEAPHYGAAQAIAINGGKMNGWDLIPGSGGQIGGQGCPEEDGYPCLVQAQPGAVPTLWSLADTYAMSDRTFETAGSASWGSHIEVVAATLDGFVGDQPTGGDGRGNGCDSGDDGAWRPGPRDITQFTNVPSCIPDKFGNGPYRESPVAYVPTIMTRLDAAGLPWHIYAPDRTQAGYGWAICPTFYECLSTRQARKVKLPEDLIKDAKLGRLGAFSIVIPHYDDSQHNNFSLIQGDNWMASNIEAIMNGPDWDSTAIFITYDDCGCFYDEVRPPPGMGIREPMVIVSPYAKPYFVDHTTASHASILAFTEHLFGLPPLNAVDANAYDYADAFDFSQRPLKGIPLPRHPIPKSSLEYLATHEPNLNDPT